MNDVTGKRLDLGTEFLIESRRGAIIRLVVVSPVDLDGNICTGCAADRNVNFVCSMMPLCTQPHCIFIESTEDSLEAHMKARLGQ